MHVHAFALLLALAGARTAMSGDPIVPVPFTRVQLEGCLLAERIETSRTATIPYALDQCERTGRIDNFRVAGGLAQGGFRGRCYDDSDVFKVVEGASYALAARPDPKLAARLAELVAAIAAAQEEDGYLYTIRTVEGAELSSAAAGPERWSHLAHSHELYNLGHLYEAAAAHFRATGERALLDVALKSAALVERVFGPGEGQRRDPPGHQEIELGLLALHRATGEARWLELARHFLEARGRHAGREGYGEYSQDHLPVAEQREAVGHAVRAGYQYAAMAELEALAGDGHYRDALAALWRDVVGSKTYVTGGVGARRHGESFGRPYELPSASAYAETCAAVGMMLWSQRMFLLEGDGRYVDVLERALFNGFLAGVELGGERFFYPNPLASDGRTSFNYGELVRAPWFECSCCPVNVARVMPSLPGLFYATAGAALHVNLYARGEARLELAGGELRVLQDTDYPWSGEVTLALGLDAPRRFELRLRVPGWARGEALPGGLYTFLGEDAPPPALRVAGEPWPLELERGYARIEREWRDGDRVQLSLPMPVRRVVADGRVADARGRVALQRGPIVHCLEAVDCGGSVHDLYLPDDAAVGVAREPELLGGCHSLLLEAGRVALVEGERVEQPVFVRAIPYHLWAHRGPGEMAVWIPRRPELARVPVPPPFAAAATASASHLWRGDTLAALNDGREPSNSSDQELPRFTWWDHRGGREWVQLDFAALVRVAGTAIYWFDDSGIGACRAPASWRLLARVGGAWRAVETQGAPGVALDRFNEIAFEPLEAEALRVEAELREGFSAGILEWRVDPAD